MLDGALAAPCNPESAIPGLNSRLRALFLIDCDGKVALIVGSCTTEAYEPGQDRKVAAVSRSLCVLQGPPA